MTNVRMARPVPARRDKLWGGFMGIWVWLFGNLFNGWPPEAYYLGHLCLLGVAR